MRNLMVVVAAFALFACNEARNKSIELMNSGVQKYNNRLFDSAERDFPILLQLCSDEAIVGVADGIAALGEARLVARLL